MDHIARFIPIIRELAEQALEQAADGAMTRPEAGKRAISLVKFLPLAKLLISGDPTDVSLGEFLKIRRVLISGDPEQLVEFRDGRGQMRREYGHMAHWLYDRSLAEASLMFDVEQRRSIAWEDPVAKVHAYDECDPDVLVHDPSFRLGRAMTSALSLCVNDADGRTLVPVWIIKFVEKVVAFAPESGPLHAHNLRDSPEEWTYDELLAIHALFGLALRIRRADWFRRIESATAYHQIHTQPDYTTYQPWALAAFVANPETGMFAEQQLHDVTTHLAIEGGPGAVVPALLLADAWFTLNSLSNQ